MNRFCLVVLLAAVVPACVVVTDHGPSGGSGERITRSADLVDFDAIVVDRKVDFLEIEVCDDCQPSLAVTGDEVEVEDVSYEVSGGELTLSGPDRHVFTATDLNCTIRTPSLDRLVLNGSGDAEITGIRAETFEVISTGSGDAKLQGTVGVLDAIVDGSGDLEAFDVRAETADITASGSGDVLVCVSGLLRARLTGSGDLVYDCSPEQKDVSSLGSGKVSVR